MKTFKVELLRWLPQEGEIIEIDWPKVHKTLGLDQCRWLLAREHTDCQIVLERRDMYCRLIAEFYDQKTLAAYHLMWAK